MAEKPRLIGIDVIGAVYIFAAILIMVLHGQSTGSTRVVFNILVPMAVATAVGMFTRINAIRIMLLVLLVISMIADAYLAILYLGGGLGGFELPDNIDPWQKLKGLPFRLGVAIWMFTYLRRVDVKAAFVNN